MFLRTLVIALAQLVAVGFVGPAHAQEASDAPGRRGGRGAAPPSVAEQDAPAVRCFDIRQSNPTKIADIVGQLYGRGRVVDVPSTGKLVFMGTPAEIAQVEALLKEIDLPDQVNAEPTLVITPVKHRPAGEVLDQLQKTIGGDSLLRISADESRGCIIALGRSSARMAAMHSILKEIDTPAARVSMEFVYFQADLNPAEEKSVIPADLQEVAGELSRFGEIRLLGRLFADSVDGGRFRVEGRIHQHVTAKVQGDVENAEEGQPVLLRFQARANVESFYRTDAGGQQSLSGSFEIETRLTMNSGEYYVVGGSPAGLAEGQSIILVVQVRR
ncbi:MAG: hypothetical protein DCC65_04485 [Planctomycetota bacterium]|nr:MAG: hypothetical protein DCC65_04485 [Planctomycetota bacterium]